MLGNDIYRKEKPSKFEYISWFF